jgi:hypothetical protein
VEGLTQGVIQKQLRQGKIRVNGKRAEASTHLAFARPRGGGAEAAGDAAGCRADTRPRGDDPLPGR